VGVSKNIFCDGRYLAIRLTLLGIERPKPDEKIKQINVDLCVRACYIYIKGGENMKKQTCNDCGHKYEGNQNSNCPNCGA
jgi:hypothetical protein